MANIFFVSDTHFSHANILVFTGADGKRIRPEFDSVQEMNEKMILNWNSVVTPQDKVYHLGDVAFGGRDTVARVFPRLNGKKRLILGNHDDVVGQALYKFFQKISVWRIFKEHNFVVSHIPILQENFRMVEFNVHGHIHEKPDMSSNHLNVSVEKTNYTPISLEEVKQRIAKK